MEDVSNLVRASLVEIEKVLSTKTVVGDPITVQDRIIIPLISVGFGFGAGGGTGEAEQRGKGKGAGGGTGGGAWVRPVGLIIVDAAGVRLESVKGGLASAIDRVFESMPQMMERCMRMWAERKKGGEEQR